MSRRRPKVSEPVATDATHLEITCSMGHKRRVLSEEPYEHEDGTRRSTWSCPSCRTTLALREESAAVLFGRVLAAGEKSVSVQFLTAAVTRGGLRT